MDIGNALSLFHALQLLMTFNRRLRDFGVFKELGDFLSEDRVIFLLQYSPPRADQSRLSHLNFLPHF